MNITEPVVAALKDSNTFKEYARAYSEATGLPIAIRPLETWQLPLRGRRNENPFCAMMAGQSRACAGCLQMQDQLAKSAVNSACTKMCVYGLTETAVPIKLGVQTIGYLQTGQVFAETPTPTSFDNVIKQVESRGISFDAEKAKAFYFGTPVVPKAKMNSISKLLGIFAEHLSLKSNQIAMQNENAESPVIKHARQYIEQNYTEDFSLADVAKAVHTSKFYFCKLFKKVTGINFTEYVARIRTEKAKNLLLNQNLRVSEIGYEVGFQSLTHFNRIFKKIVGESPTEYRAHLPSI